MGKIYEFGDCIIIVKDKISAVIREPDSTKLIIYLEGTSDGIAINHSSVENRDKSYEFIKKDFSDKLSI